MQNISLVISGNKENILKMVKLIDNTKQDSVIVNNEDVVGSKNRWYLILFNEAPNLTTTHDVPGYV